MASRLWRAAQRDTGLILVLAMQIAVVFVVAPLAATGAASSGLTEMLRFGLAAATTLIIARRMVVRAMVVAMFVATLLGTQLPLYSEPRAIVTIVNVIATLAFDLTVASLVGAATFRPGKVTAARILGAVILYLYAALIFAGLYRLLELILPQSFSGLPLGRRSTFAGLLYFSLGTLTTAGAGPIAPIHPFVRSMAALEAVIGQLFPATLLARLVTLHASHAGRPLERD